MAVPPYYLGPPAPEGMPASIAFTGVVSSDYAWIPNDGANRDWQAYQEWVAAGNTAQPFADLPPQPGLSGG